jgi:hypothetical protein
MSEDGSLGRLRPVALIALVAGADGSVALMLYAGRSNPYPLVVVGFVIWVLSPFVVLLLAHMVSKRWSLLTRAALYGLMLVLALGSLAIYGYAASSPLGTRTTPFFVAVAPLSWLLTAVVLALAGLIAGRQSRRR